METPQINENQEIKKVTKWTTVKIPVELRDTINKLSQKLGKPAWKVVLDSVSFFDEQISKPRLKEKLPTIDKISWYIVKLSTSVSEFKLNPSEENYNRLIKTMNQIKERLGVDLSLLSKIVETYKKDPSIDNRIELNDALKLLIFELITDKLLEIK